MILIEVSDATGENDSVKSTLGTCILGLYDASSFLSAFNNLPYKDVSVSVSFLWYVRYDDFSEEKNLRHSLSLIRDYMHRHFVFWF